MLVFHAEFDFLMDQRTVWKIYIECIDAIGTLDKTLSAWNALRKGNSNYATSSELLQKVEGLQTFMWNLTKQSFWS